MGTYKYRQLMRYTLYFFSQLLSFPFVSLKSFASTNNVCGIALITILSSKSLLSWYKIYNYLVYNLYKFPCFSNFGSSFIPLSVNTSKLCANIIKFLYSAGDNRITYSSTGLLLCGSIIFIHLSKIAYDDADILLSYQKIYFSSKINFSVL